VEFTTDGRRLYFTLSDRESDLWQMELSAGPDPSPLQAR
jgi:hypothetical protein